MANSIFPADFSSLTYGGVMSGVQSDLAAGYGSTLPGGNTTTLGGSSALTGIFSSLSDMTSGTYGTGSVSPYYSAFSSAISGAASIANNTVSQLSSALSGTSSSSGTTQKDGVVLRIAVGVLAIVLIAGGLGVYIFKRA